MPKPEKPKMMHTAPKNRSVVAWVPKLGDWYHTRWNKKNKNWIIDDIYNDDDNDVIHPTHWVKDYDGTRYDTVSGVFVYDN